jgi:Tfp pilus assembly protein PilF
VISRTSATVYTDTRKPLPQIARELNVDAVLTGSVERSAKRIRVRTELIRPGTAEVLWANTYDRDVDDLLRLEGEVSQAIAREVGIKLTPQVQHRLEHRPTSNPEAREAYLRALYFLDKGDKEGATKCLQYFQEAIAKDPGYAAAYAGLSRCYQLAEDFGLLSDNESTSKATAAVKKAVQLDDELAEAHAELGDYYLGEKWDYGAAEREYKRAIELDPNLSVAHSSYGFLLVDLGRMEQGLKEMHRARELDPLSLDIAESTGIRLLSSRRYDEALAQFRSVLEMKPDYTRARWMLARTYELKGMYKEAISECLKIPALPNIDAVTKARFKRRCSLYEKIYTTSRRERFNRKWVELARQEIKDGIYNDAYFIATLYAETGENVKALDLLERSYAQHDSELLQLKVDPRLDNVRPDPRFQTLLRRMNFPE